MTIPALFMIDTLGRRPLLLFTFPLMGVFFLIAGLSYIEKDCMIQTHMVRAFCYLFVASYSLGEGPVPLVITPCSEILRLGTNSLERSMLRKVSP